MRPNIWPPIWLLLWTLMVDVICTYTAIQGDVYNETLRWALNEYVRSNYLYIHLKAILNHPIQKLFWAKVRVICILYNLS